MEEQEEKRTQLKKKSVAITKLKEEPFSFYEREKNKKEKSLQDNAFKLNNKFKAKPIPAFIYFFMSLK